MTDLSGKPVTAALECVLADIVRTAKATGGRIDARNLGRAGVADWRPDAVREADREDMAREATTAIRPTRKDRSQRPTFSAGRGVKQRWPATATFAGALHFVTNPGRAA
jgi:hypothetical protein